MIKKQKHKNKKQKDEMCKINVKTNLYFANICKHEHEITWQSYGARSCLRLMLNKLKKMKGFTPIYTIFGPKLKEASK